MRKQMAFPVILALTVVLISTNACAGLLVVNAADGAARTENETVCVDATVTDSRGSPVGGLSNGSFRLVNTAAEGVRAPSHRSSLGQLNFSIREAFTGSYQLCLSPASGSGWPKGIQDYELRFMVEDPRKGNSGMFEIRVKMEH